MYLEHSQLKVIGVDMAKNGDVSIATVGYYKDGILHITSIEKINQEE